MAQPAFSPSQFIQRTPGAAPFNLLNYGPVTTGGGFGAGAGELPEWMKPFVPIDTGGSGGGTTPPSPAPWPGGGGRTGEFLIRMPTIRPPDPRVVEQTPYLQPINENPFQGQLGGASGEGDSVQMPGGMVTGPAQVMNYPGGDGGVVGNLMRAPEIPPPPEPTAAAQVMNYPENSTGWVPPIFPNDGKDGNLLEKAKYWLDGQSDGGVLKDIAAVGAHGLNYLLTPELASRGGGMLGNAINPYAGAAGALLGGMVGENVIHPWVGEQIDKWANPRADPGMWGDPDNTAQQEAAMAGQIPNISIPNAELRSPEAKPEVISPPQGERRLVDDFDTEGVLRGQSVTSPFGPINPDANGGLVGTAIHNNPDGSQTRELDWADGSKTIEHVDADGKYQGATKLSDTPGGGYLDLFPSQPDASDFDVSDLAGVSAWDQAKLELLKLADKLGIVYAPPSKEEFDRERAGRTTEDYINEKSAELEEQGIGRPSTPEVLQPRNIPPPPAAPNLDNLRLSTTWAENDFGLGDFFNKDYGFDSVLAQPVKPGENKASPDAWRDNLLWTQSNSVDRLMSEWEKFLKDREEHEEMD